jgi:hypothetical protein
MSKALKMKPTSSWVRGRSLCSPHGHGDGAPHAGLDVDDEALFVVADVDGQRVLVRGKDTEDLDLHDIRIHT